MEAITQTLSTVGGEVQRCLERVSVDSINRASKRIEAADQVFLAGAGRSGLAIRGFAMRLMHLGKQVHVVGETTTPAVAACDLLVIGSGSGRTESLLAMARKAKSIGATVLLVTIDPTSPVGELADDVVQIPAPSPKASSAVAAQSSIQPMGALFEQCLFLLLDAMIVMLMSRAGIAADEMFARHANLE